MRIAYSLLLGIALLLSCESKRATLLEGFSEAFMGVYSLKLHPDKTFMLELPAGKFQGVYKLYGDTIVLTYMPDSGKNLPEAYLINNAKRSLDELEKVDQHFEPSKHKRCMNLTKW